MFLLNLAVKIPRTPATSAIPPKKATKIATIFEIAPETLPPLDASAALS